jgi:hypothetical protein
MAYYETKSRKGTTPGGRPYVADKKFIDTLKRAYKRK